MVEVVIKVAILDHSLVAVCGCIALVDIVAVGAFEVRHHHLVTKPYSTSLVIAALKTLGFQFLVDVSRSLLYSSLLLC